MLRKLLKHEFRATARIMGPLYLILLATAVGANVSTRVMMNSGSQLLNILGALLVMAFAVAIMAILVVSLLLMIQRFYKNLLRDEGYLMFTLPVSVHQQVWSKLIVSAVWFLATFVVVFVALGVMAYDVGMVQSFVYGLGQIFEGLDAYYALNGTAMILELLALAFFACVAFSLQFYAAMAVGHSFSNHKVAMSVLFFFVFQFVIQAVSLTLTASSASVGFLANLDFQLQGVAAFHAGMGILIGLEVLYGAIFYVVTTLTLKKRLNLE